MAQKEDFPKEPPPRVLHSDITISKATVSDIPSIVQGLYASFPPSYWARKEPLALRPLSEKTRHTRLAKRITPTFSSPYCNWLVARYTPTGEIIACACWIAPGSPIHNMFRKSAVDFYGWREQYFPSSTEFEELWEGVDLEQWDGYFSRNDATREDVLGEEPHWYLASLCTWPAWQGRGVGRLLVEWGCEKADAEERPVPLYLESSREGRRLYVSCGFVELGGEDNYLRRGPEVGRRETRE
jgi:GNAT superfamily N-acetyltransferase